MGRQVATIMAAGAMLLVAACGGDDVDQIADADSRPADEAAADPADEQSPSGEEETDSSEGEDASATSVDCEPGPGKTVTPIDGVTIEAQHEPEVVVEDQVIGGETIPGFVVPELDIPQQTVDGGCIVEHDAPGGCLGKVEIAGFEIPERVMPGYEIPEVVTSDGEVLYEGYSVDEVVLDSVAVEDVVIDEVCQIVPDEEDGTVWSVTRWGETRWGETQWGETQWGDTRDEICIGDECTEAVDVPTRDTPSVSVDSVSVDSKSLPTYELEGTDTQVLEGEDQTAYLAPADVLFEFDEAELGGDAVPTLESIVAAIQEDFSGGATVTVEGHTDSRGEADYNQTLSEDRAEAVADWLASEGGIDQGQITTAGYGETLPVAPNENEDGSDNPEGRAQNRRVVITVTAE